MTKVEVFSFEAENTEDEFIHHVFLKHGLVANIPETMIESFISNNDQIIEGRKLNVRGKRRTDPLV
jgi:hypothetical protein